MTGRIIPAPAAVAEWRRIIQEDAGCMKQVPHTDDPYDVAAYNEAARQLAAEARAEASAELEAST